MSALRDSGELGFRSLDNPTYKAMSGVRHFFARPRGRAGIIDTWKPEHRAQLEAVARNSLRSGEEFLASGYTNERRVVVVSSQRLLSVQSKRRCDGYELKSLSDTRLKRLPFSGVLSCRGRVEGSSGVKRFTIIPLEEAIAFHHALGSATAGVGDSGAAAEGIDDKRNALVSAISRPIPSICWAGLRSCTPQAY